ncbi:MAG TPA: helix-turn-helix domain-containing protein [Elusimicrobiales bacterium]|nr:helix-turn-helix domain-containing protein [Elusimicrobiales bacterium]
MPDIGKLLKEEIKRLAQRSLRASQLKLKKDVVELKRAASALKKENARLLRELGKIKTHLRGAMPALHAHSGKKPEEIRIGPKLVLAQRKRLGLSREEFAKLLGVSAGAVVSWEMGKVRPRENIKPLLASVRKLGRRTARERLELLSSH